jgi:hypothetical protein
MERVRRHPVGQNGHQCMQHRRTSASSPAQHSMQLVRITLSSGCWGCSAAEVKGRRAVGATRRPHSLDVPRGRNRSRAREV